MFCTFHCNSLVDLQDHKTATSLDLIQRDKTVQFVQVEMKNSQ